MKGRFAPSPTGYMHLGNLWIALLSYLSVREQGGKYILRIEDIDKCRSKKEYEEALLEDLQWLGIEWDEGPDIGGPNGPYRQSERTEIYEDILEKWHEQGLIYPCFCNRARIQKVSSAPHPGEKPYIYDGLCYNLSAADIAEKERKKKPSWRLKTNSQEFEFNDKIQGLCYGKVRYRKDDIVLQRADDMYAYQFAVSIDDGLMDVSEVLRGADLLESTAIQLSLLKLLNIEPPQYAHAPVILDKNGNRISKRQKGITIRELREGGMSAAQIIGNLLYSTGISEKPEPISVKELLNKKIPWNSLKKNDIILTKFDTEDIIAL